MGEFAVPVVDIGPYVGDGPADRRADVARRMDAACRTVGFVQVTGHGVPASTIAGLAAAMDAFFDLPATDKAAHRVATGNRGYSPPRSESLRLSAGVEQASRMNDFFEAFNIGAERAGYPGRELPQEYYADNHWPDVPLFGERVLAYFAQARRVARTLTAVFADALGVPPGFFDVLTDHSIDVLRMNNYALPEGAVTLDGDLVGMGEHTDFGIVTVLWADDVPGLQVLGTDQAWHDVSPMPGALLVNLGDLTARLTGDEWMSTLHRVLPPVVDGRIRRRRSAALFHDGNADAVVATLAGFPEGYEPVTVAEHIAAKLAGSRQGRRNAAAHREAARVRSATP